MIIERENEALLAQNKLLSSVEEAYNYIEKFDILETINNVGNDEIFTPVKLCNEILDALPEEVWSNPKYKWLNPCDKNGVFSREIALRLDEGLKTAIPNQEARRRHIMKNMLFSLGLTKFTALVARRTLYYCSVANRKFTKEEEGYAIGNGTWFDDNEGNIKTPITEHSFDKKGRCIYCGTSKQVKYTDPKQIEHYAYEFLHNDNIEEHLQKRFFKGNKNMKFDIIIGNPPYQLADGGAQASAKPIYHLFFNKAKIINPKYISLIIPSRWMSGGKGLDSFREEMIADKRFSKLIDYINAKECFPSNDVKGGVCYFLWDRDHNDKCKITTHYSDGTKRDSERYLNEGGMDTYIRDEILLSISKKVKATKKFSTIISPRKPYGLSGEVFVKPEKYGLPPFEEKSFQGSLEVYGLIKLKREVRYISAKNEKIKDPMNNINKWKVFLPESNGSGAIGEVLSTPIIGTPMSICTETFLSIGRFDSQEQAKNCISYIKTKFFRTLLGIKKISQHNTKEVFSFVPIQDFSKPWTDKELYEKYKLSQEEIDYIEKHIKEMD